MENVYLSVIIPAFNEEVRIIKTLETVLEYLKKQKYSYELIVVNDGSADKTAEIVNGFIKYYSNIKLLNNDKNMGKGYCVKKGMLEASGNYLLFSDADLSTPITEVNKLLSFVTKDYSIAIGSRSLKGSEILVHQPFYRELMGKIFNRIIKIMLFKGFIDTQCGFKLFRKETAKQLFTLQKLNGFAFDVEVLYLALKNNYRVKEVPIKWINSSQSKVNAISSSLSMFCDLFKIRNYHRGRH